MSGVWGGLILVKAPSYAVSRLRRLFGTGTYRSGNIVLLLTGVETTVALYLTFFTSTCSAFLDSCIDSSILRNFYDVPYVRAVCWQAGVVVTNTVVSVSECRYRVTGLVSQPEVVSKALSRQQKRRYLEFYEYMYCTATQNSRMKHCGIHFRCKSRLK